jgi:hypothetical protein
MITRDQQTTDLAKGGPEIFLRSLQSLTTPVGSPWETCGITGLEEAWTLLPSGLC